MSYAIRIKRNALQHNQIEECVQCIYPSCNCLIGVCYLTTETIKKKATLIAKTKCKIAIEQISFVLRCVAAILTRALQWI